MLRIFRPCGTAAADFAAKRKRSGGAFSFSGSPSQGSNPFSASHAKSTPKGYYFYE